MHHKRKLNFKNFKENKEDYIWSLFWYGRVFFNYKNSKFYIEAYLVLLQKENYYLNNFDKNRIEKVEIPFSKSVLFPLSSQFDFEGKLLKISNGYNSKGNSEKNGLYVFNKISLDNKDFRITNLENIFSDTLFPNVFENDESIYLGASYYVKDKYNRKYIIPIDVILKYFFGYSSLLFYLLISNVLKDAILEKSFDEKTKRGKLFYNSKLISRADVSFVAKYYFTKNDFAEKLFLNIGSYFASIRLNNSTKKSFIKFKIPFDFTCHFTLVGQYISEFKPEVKDKIVIINEILDIKGEENFFLITEEIDIIDINSSQENNNRKGSTNNNGRPKPTTDPNLDGEESDEPPLDQNNSVQINNNPVILRRSFNFSPKINPMAQYEDEKGNKFFFNDNRPDDHKDFSKYNGGKKKKKVNNELQDKWPEIIEKAIHYLVNVYKYQFTVLSSIEDSLLTNKIIYELIYNNSKYYLVESGAKNYFPLFRNSIYGLDIDYDDINRIIDVINKKYKGSWLVLSRKKSLKDVKHFDGLEFLKKNDVVFLRNNTHQIVGEGKENYIDLTAGTIAKKIHNKILKDLG